MKEMGSFHLRIKFQSFLWGMPPPPFPTWKAWVFCPRKLPTPTFSFQLLLFIFLKPLCTMYRDQILPITNSSALVFVFYQFPAFFSEFPVLSISLALLHHQHVQFGLLARHL